MASPQIIVQHLIYDGAMFGVPCDGSRNVEARPVTVPMGAQCVLRLAFRNPATFATVMPERAFDAAAWRFELRDRIGAEHTVLFATAEARPDDDHIDIDMSGTFTDELAAALGERTVGEFPAMLSGYDSDKERIVSVVFRLRIGNTTDDEAVPEGADSLYKQVQEARATANDAEKKATEADGKAQDALDGLAGKADLVGGKVPSSQLPSYVDDVVEYASRSAFPATGEAGKIYVALDTNKTYRWSGSEYVQVGGGDAPVQSVNGQTGTVVLAAADVGAATVADATLTDMWSFTDGLLEAACAIFDISTDGKRLAFNESPEPEFPEQPDTKNVFGFKLLNADGEQIGSDLGVARRHDLRMEMLGAHERLLAVVPQGGTVATYSGYRLGPVDGPNVDKLLAPAGDYALKSEIPDVPVKAVKRNGTALVPDAQGAVNVEVPTVPTFPLSVANGGTGATTAEDARANLGAMSATANGNTILTGGTEWDRAPIGVFADSVTREVYNRLELAQAAEPYDETKTYHAGDLCTHGKNLYVCGTETTGPWNIIYWTVTNLADAISAKQDAIPDLATIRSGAAAGATAVQPGQRNLLDYTTGTTLAPQTAVYRAALNADGTFPTVDATAIPTASAYYCFEMELAVPATVPASITGPTGWTWLDGGDLPAPSVLSGGETIYVACRMDCATRAVTANVWRVA